MFFSAVEGINVDGLRPFFPIAYDRSLSLLATLHHDEAKEIL